MSGYLFFAVECLPKVVDEKLKKITVSLQSVVKTKVDSGQTQVECPDCVFASGL